MAQCRLPDALPRPFACACACARAGGSAPMTPEPKVETRVIQDHPRQITTLPPMIGERVR
jgi:hypothetical protein